MLKKIGWFPAGDFKNASVRLRSYYIIDFLKNEGIEVKINDTSPDVLIFQKCLSEDKLEVALLAKKKKKHLIYDISDNVRSDMNKYRQAFNIAKTFITTSDKVVVNGVGLKKYFLDKFRKDAFIIEDPYPPEAPKIKKKHHGSDPSLVWHGYFKNMLMYVFGQFMSPFDIKLWKKSGLEKPIDFRKIGQKLITVSEPEMSLRFLANRPTYLYPSTYPKAIKLIIKGDIGIAPLRLWDVDCFGKSANKIVSYMMLGLPTIASPIPAYEREIKNGENGFLAKTEGEWISAFEKLQDPQVRSKIGEAGFRSVSDKFDIKTIGKKWMKLLTT